MAEPLPLLDTAKFAAKHTWKNRIAIGKLIILAGLVNGLVAWLMVNEALAVWVYMLFAGGVYTLLAVNVHRLVLTADTKLVLYPWTWRETRFLGWFLLIYSFFGVLFVLAMAVIALPSGHVLFQNGGWTDELLAVLVTLPGGYLVVRLSPLLPATAIDRRPQMTWAWKLTEGNGWRLLALLWFLPMLITSVVSGAVDTPALFVIGHILISVGTAFEVALLSSVFNKLVGDGHTPVQVTTQS